MCGEIDGQSQKPAEEGGPITWRINFERAQQLVQWAVAESPLTHRYGLCMTDSGGAMPEITTYYWCESVPDLMELAFEAIPVLFGTIEPDRLDEPSQRELAEELLDDLRKAKDKYAKQVEGGASGTGQTVSFDCFMADWIGTFEELCEGRGSLEIEVREQFWESRDYDLDSDDDAPPPRSDPIPDELKAEFADSLEQHG